ncbi:MAG: P-II family nitrogen regulator [Nitrospiraceae bacterium]
MIVARDSMLSELEERLRDNGISAYTIINDVMGKGLTGRLHGTFLQPDTNSIIFSVLPSDQAERAVSALRALHKDLTAHGHPVSLKVFTLPCEEHL